ncbi:class II aldolase/adducin family protein [Flammeovirga sp. MY04]|uniref:class II aldolase/adducin family protein n=1 Tax=Flammeovirga sp. MY04 TaxID=1191459 RepID=UPI0008063C42|nr:class II aldolase/adducin family protein [Flammeovirga sp. MY04]ANQ51792.1 class II aldolase/adducin family protein [Flammeovirga sp. MY04]
MNAVSPIKAKKIDKKSTSDSNWKITPELPKLEFEWEKGSDPVTRTEVELFYKSKAIKKLRKDICIAGRRLWERGYVDGNGGNITVRVGDNLVLCTPTLISKGLMKPKDICLIDLDGNQKAGHRPRTSEALTHLAIMRRMPAAKACVHAHPPHGTAFAIASIVPPTGVIPEADIFLGQMGLAKYETPGSPENAEVIGETAIDHQAVLMENHGVIVWGSHLEDAYWKMENVEAICQTVMVATTVSPEISCVGIEKAKDMIAIRQKLGMYDKRANWSDDELLQNDYYKKAKVVNRR